MLTFPSLELCRVRFRLFTLPTLSRRYRSSAARRKYKGSRDHVSISVLTECLQPFLRLQWLPDNFCLQ